MNTEILAAQLQLIKQAAADLGNGTISNALQAASLTLVDDRPELSTHLESLHRELMRVVRETELYFAEVITEEADMVMLNNDLAEQVEDSEIGPQGEVIYTLTDGSAVIVQSGRIVKVCAD